MAAPVVVTDDTFDKEVLKSELPVLVDFWAPWCAPCRVTAPWLEEIAEKYDGRVKVVKLNTDENPDRAKIYDIRGLPSFVLFQNGKETNRVLGAMKKELEAMVDKLS